MLFFVVVALGLNRELLPHLTDALPGNAGDPMLNAWILSWVSDTAVSSPSALWNAPIFHPHPNALAFSEHLIGIAVFVAPIYWLTGDPILLYNITFLLGFAFLGWAMFMLVRALAGREDAAIVAGVVVMCSPYFVSSQVARLQMLTAGWSLLTLLCLHRWLETDRRRTLAGVVACWALQIHSNVYLGLFLTVPVALILAVDAVRRPAVRTLRRAGRLIAAATILGAVSAPALLQYAEAQKDMGLAHPKEEVRQYSASVRSYATVWDERDPSWLWADNVSDRTLFPGAPLAVCALVGAGLAIRRRVTGRGSQAAVTPAVYLLVAGVVFILTLGPEPAIGDAPFGGPSPYALLLDLVPALDGIRAPGRFAVFVVWRSASSPASAPRPCSPDGADRSASSPCRR